MFKKKLAVMATVLCLTVTSVVSAFGATSPSTSESDSTSNVTLDQNTTSALSDSLPVATADADKVTAVEEGGSKLDDGITLHVSSISEADYQDLLSKVTSGTPVAQAEVYVTRDSDNATLSLASLTLTMNVSGASASKSYVVYHKKADGTYETVNATSGNGTVTFTITGCSPLIVVELPESAASTTTSSTVSSSDSATGVNTSTTSPKTGETVTASLIALISLAGAVVCLRKLAVR